MPEGFLVRFPSNLAGKKEAGRPVGFFSSFSFEPPGTGQPVGYFSSFSFEQSRTELTQVEKQKVRRLLLA